MSFPKYPSTRRWDSDGIAELPEHWVERRLRDVAQVVNGFPFESSLFAPERGLPLVRIRDLGRETTEMRYAGDIVTAALIDSTDVLIGMDGDFTVGRWLGPGQALLNQRVCCVRGRNPMITRFIEYNLPRPLQAINDVTYSTTVKHLSSGQVEAIRLVMPPLDEEIASVVHFLDRETAKIDALIAEQERLIALLQEKRQAVISHAVTKGLDPRVPMKDSGLDWIGKTPAHWRSQRLSWLFRREKRQGYAGHDVLSVYRDYGVIRKDSRADNLNKTPDDLSVYQLVCPGDLVINKMKAWQGSLGIASLEGITSPDYVVFTPTHDEDSRFLHLMLRSSRLVSCYLGISNGIRLGQWRIEPEQFLALRVILPPLSEQREITAFVQSELDKYDAITADADHQIALLRERRTALITAAVTGQIDVRGLVETAA